MKTNEIHILKDILKTIAASENPEQSIDRIVRMISHRFNIDVCSLYIYNPYVNNLVLKATVGLNKDSVGEIEMDVNEGLTGMAIETMAPVFIVNPSSHPRYKHYAGSGEEVYKTFLALPIIYHKKVLGALVVQTLAPEGIQRSAIGMFTSIARQISATVAFTILQEDRQNLPFGKKTKSTEEKTDGEEDSATNLLRGEPVSDRVASGFAFYMFERIDFDQIRLVSVKNAESETVRLEKAFAASADQIRQVSENAREVSGNDKSIIEAHLMFLSDRSLKRKIIKKIGEKLSAEYALKLIIFEYVTMFESMDDPYLKERSSDILDIGRRVLGNLVGINSDSHQAFTRETIIIASDFSPVDLLAIRQPNLKGIVLARGGRTSHTVIVARSLEIPIVIGVEGIPDRIRSGDYLIVDGVSGIVYVNPEPEIKDKYDRRQKDNTIALKKLEGLRDLPAMTSDGFKVSMGANIGLLSDMMLASQYGADDIGLYRTEFPFLLRKSFPSENEQTLLYKRVLERAKEKSVSIRTFDVGGDKFLSYMDYPREDNPFLGWRSIRLSLDLEDIFRVQIRAILRASAFGMAKILFPMISSVGEIRKIVEIVTDEKKNLDQGGIPYDKDIELGIMVEVPAAVPILEKLLRYVDFVNIGTNDLIQYLLAVDRNNKKVAALYDMLHPAVIAVVADIVSMCKRLDKKVCVCGEAASVNESILLFVGMGADHLSMMPSAIPGAKQFIRSMDRDKAKTILDRCLGMEDAKEIRSFLAVEMERFHCEPSCR